MKNFTSTQKRRTLYSLPFHSVRNISSPEDVENGRKIYSGQTTIQSILQLPTDENVRSYLLDAEGRQRRRPTAVHKAIRETILNTPFNFSVLNSGITLVAKGVDIDEKEKHLKLINPSIINGAQTQGVIVDLANEELLPEEDVHIKFEIIVTEDDDLIADVSIARNYQNDVMSISIAGRKGQLDELEESLQKSVPGLRLRKSETELTSEDYADTEKLIQVLTALIPVSLWPRANERDNPNKVYTYSAKAKCLKDFQEVFKKAKDENDPDHKYYEDLYQFFLDFVGDAYTLYYHWKSHQGFSGTRLRSLTRDGDEIIDVPDGIVFPIIASLSVFVKKEKGRWRFMKPEILRDEELIRAAKSIYMEMADSNPQTMGKSKACYSGLLQITSIYEKLSPKSK
jgi:hypothetical protein